MSCFFFQRLFSSDTPDGTGDHENYFQNVQKNNVYEINGDEYTNCSKTAIHIRSKGGQEQGHKSWWNLKEYTFFFSKRSKYFSSPKTLFIEVTRAVRPEYR